MAQHRPGPFSRIASLAKLDGRTPEGKALEQLKVEFGDASAIRRHLRENAAQLQLRMDMLNRKLNEQGDGLLSESASKYFLAWHGACERSLVRLLLLEATKPAPPVLTLADYLSGKSEPVA